MERKNIMACMRALKSTSSARNGTVCRDQEDRINISWCPVEGYEQYLVDLTTYDARLLAKRINQFLDAGG